MTGLTPEQQSYVERGELPPQVTIADLHPNGISDDLARNLIRVLRLGQHLARDAERVAHAA